MTESFNRLSGPAALLVSMIALAFAMTGVSGAERGDGGERATTAAKRGVVRLKKGKIPSKYIPTVRNARRLGNRAARRYLDSCSPTTVDLDTWCLQTSPYPLLNEDTGKNNYFWATQKCTEEGGFLPSAGQLVGAADRVKLASTINDDELTASIDLDGTDGLKDRREMSSSLVTTAAGSSAAGSQGVTEGSRGDPKQGEPDPVPQPADPAPFTLQYVTVYDNRNKGGFAGSKPVNQPEAFRCGFYKKQGPQAAE